MTNLHQLKRTPFHARTAALCLPQNWRRWAGHIAVGSYDLGLEREYWAIRNHAALIDVSPLMKYLIEGPDAAESVARDLLKRLDELFARVSYTPIRLHGDCHPGNLLCRDDSFHIVDLDDCRTGPALQDLWMMIGGGERHERLSQLAELIEGYQEFHDFDSRELPLLEGLRSLRLIHYSAWLARRWDDPAFPMSFPWFGSERYWGEQILILREQLSALDEEPLRLY